MSFTAKTPRTQRFISFFFAFSAPFAVQNIFKGADDDAAGV
jgi:hypothetical protein